MNTFIRTGALLSIKPQKRGNKKTIKKLLAELGFHHCFGYYFRDEDLSMRLSVKTTQKSKRTHINVGYYNMYSGQSIDVNDVNDKETLMDMINKKHEATKNIWK